MGGGSASASAGLGLRLAARFFLPIGLRQSAPSRTQTPLMRISWIRRSRTRISPDSDLPDSDCPDPDLSDSDFSASDLPDSDCPDPDFSASDCPDSDLPDSTARTRICGLGLPDSPGPGLWRIRLCGSEVLDVLDRDDSGGGVSPAGADSTLSGSRGFSWRRLGSFASVRAHHANDEQNECTQPEQRENTDEPGRPSADPAVPVVIARRGWHVEELAPSCPQAGASDHPPVPSR